ncbi:MAG: phytanoyl-CoA dioxygenase family protein [Candidatus Eiseniibacteriota bacterium]
MATTTALSLDERRLAPWLMGRTFAEWRAAFDRDGYVVFDSVLTPAELAAIRDALAPHLARNIVGRNDFEGLKTNRVYALLAKSPVFAALAIHPLALAFAEAELGPSCLLSSLVAISLQPGETAQSWHHDDGYITAPRPRPAWGLSMFWAIDDTTATNGATEVLPGSHLWPDGDIPGGLKPSDFTNTALRDVDDDPGARPDAVKAVMPAGSLMLAKGTLLHRGGANRSNRARLIVTSQYCVGWARQLENLLIEIPPALAATLPERARELIGYSVHPPFMGHVDGLHPRHVVERARS